MAEVKVKWGQCERCGIYGKIWDGKKLGEFTYWFVHPRCLILWLKERGIVQL